MMKKECSLCHKLLPLSAFNKQRHGKYGVRGRCRECSNALLREYVRTHEDHVKVLTAASRKRCWKKASETKAKYRDENRECIRAWHRRHYKQNKDMYKEKERRRFSTERGKKWRSDNHRRRLSTDPQYKLTKILRSRMWAALQPTKKKKGTIELIGCKVEFLMEWLSSKFERGMSWDNYGKWHVDHIRPCSSFDLTDESEQKKCFHYTNLQPLWAEDNLRKGGG